MAKFIKEYEGWIQWIFVLIIACIMYFLNTNYATKEEISKLATKLELKESLDDNKKDHTIILDKLSLNLEYNVKFNYIITKMEDHETRIRILEKVAAQNHPVK